MRGQEGRREGISVCVCVCACVRVCVCVGGTWAMVIALQHTANVKNLLMACVNTAMISSCTVNAISSSPSYIILCYVHVQGPPAESIQTKRE